MFFSNSFTNSTRFSLAWISQSLFPLYWLLFDRGYGLSHLRILTSLITFFLQIKEFKIWIKVTELHVRTFLILITYSFSNMSPWYLIFARTVPQYICGITYLRWPNSHMYGRETPMSTDERNWKRRDLIEDQNLQVWMKVKQMHFYVFLLYC